MNSFKFCHHCALLNPPLIKFADYQTTTKTRMWDEGRGVDILLCENHLLKLTEDQIKSATDVSTNANIKDLVKKHCSIRAKR